MRLEELIKLINCNVEYVVNVVNVCYYFCCIFCLNIKIEFLGS